MYPALLAVTRDWDVGSIGPGITNISEVYSTALKPVITPLLLAGVAAYAVARNGKDQPQKTPTLPRHEAAVLLGFALVPLFIVPAGFINHHLIFFPYCILCVLGLAGWSALSLH
jgi:hypothetical protein